MRLVCLLLPVLYVTSVENIVTIAQLVHCSFVYVSSGNASVTCETDARQA